MGVNRCEVMRARRDSNPRPPDPKSGALSTELRAHRVKVYHQLIGLVKPDLGWEGTKSVRAES